MKVTRTLCALLCSLLMLFSWIGIAAFAETPLPDGAVKGLPERLAALDDEGRPVNSATGEYFFRVEQMVLGETYTKDIQLINLCEDKSYHIYFCVEPLFQNGEIDLEQGCTCRFSLDGSEFYSGSVNGAGNIDLTQYYDCTFHEMVANAELDNGWRLVDVDGVHVLRGPDGDGSVSGEIEFKWIFCASMGQSNEDPVSPPYTGVMLQDGFVWLLAMAVIAVLIAGMLVMIRKKK